MEKVMDFIVNLFVDKGIIIAVATFVVAQIIKGFDVPKKIIPLVGGLLGIILGISIPNLFPDYDIITSGIMGLALGWSATGGYETIKNLKKKEVGN